ncbi:MAG: hypothetical protein IJL78_03700 [Lachnospiraceae bacterium]|nr:hypothetical protein [Lachnospiraceae bacterium]
MKKLTTILLCVLLAGAFLLTSACRSRLAEGLENYEKSLPKEFDLEAAYSEAQGYHYPGTEWGDTVGSLQKSIGVTVSKIAGYGENNVIVYEADSLRTQLLGRNSDGSNIGCVGDVIYMMSFVFESESAYTSVIGQEELRDQYVAKMTEAYGEPTEHKETQNEVSEVTYYYETWYWDAQTPDGKDTQIQFATASAVPGGEPSYLTLGVVWITDEVFNQSETESGEGE